MELREHLSRLVVDSWRENEGFSPDLASANERLFSAASNDIRESVLGEWLGRYQPCLFGRLAARSGALSFCVLSTDDLERDDEHVKATIQAARRRWSRTAYQGRSSGFVLAVVSPAVAKAVPDPNLLEFSRRLAFLYLREEISTDTAHLENVCLEIPGDDRETWLWRGGVNFFASAGDRRWWHDHRIPGGLALSVNSVGHLVKSGRLTADSETLNHLMGITEQTSPSARIDSLPKALEFAMRTIDMAANTISGQATQLISVQGASTNRCPVQLPPNLQGKDHSEYMGWYDTDATLPSDYFLPDVARPDAVLAKKLDFTYFFDKSVDDGDHDLMGEGRRIRTSAPLLTRSAAVRALRGYPIGVPISKLPLLREALMTAD